VGQLEYYRSVIATGVYPARRIGLVSTTALYATALWAPALHELVLPAAAAAVMLWFLLLRVRVKAKPTTCGDRGRPSSLELSASRFPRVLRHRFFLDREFFAFQEKPGSISEISSSIMGIFYLGLLPSFWVRLRAAPDLPAITAEIPGWLAGASFSPGALAMWWICLAVVSSDVGAYFGGKVSPKGGPCHARSPLARVRSAPLAVSPSLAIGRQLAGKTPLSAVGRGAAGRTSPNKTVEGAAAGMAASAAVRVPDAKPR
jgi:hypothetical protein